MLCSTTFQGKIMQVGFLGALGLIFITLKLTGFIDWAWIWVLSPLWIIAILILLVVLVGFIFAALGHKVRFYIGKNK
jgi:hypothetical protein